MAIDPICKMTVDEKTAKWRSDYKGKAYYFCAPGCKAEFEKKPGEVRGVEGPPILIFYFPEAETWA